MNSNTCENCAWASALLAIIFGVGQLVLVAEQASVAPFMLAGAFLFGLITVGFLLTSFVKE